MKRTTLSILAAIGMAAALSASAWANDAPQVSDITASQRDDGSRLVDIYYDLSDADGDACTVAVEVSDDDGATWSVPITSVTGDVGAGIMPGTNKHIIWNSATDLPGAFGSQYKVSICADDGQSDVPTGMVTIPGGSFSMGDSFAEGNGSELPVHTVTLSTFYMDKYEVTKELWRTVRTWSTSNGYGYFTAGSGRAADHPVSYINWFDCVKWCNARSEQEGRTPCYYTNAGLTTVYKTGEVATYVKWNANGYRLPTEAEWEKAARGGVAGRRFPWSDTNTIQHARANYRSVGDYAYDTSPTSGYHPDFDDRMSPYTSPVGHFAPNDYGLYDMSGNASEWCNDWYASGYYSEPDATQLDPDGPGSGSFRVVRGGSWISSADNCRLAGRRWTFASYRSDQRGFRCALGTP